MLSPKTFRVSLTPTLPEQPGVTENVSGEKTPAETWWEQVVAEFAIEAGGTFERWLDDAALSPMMRAPIPSSWRCRIGSELTGYATGWRGVARKLSVMTHRQASVSFILAVDALVEAA
ncbi:MAG: hypothetical protein U0X20_11985 [Caldilineaceae bacterium]